MGLPSERTYRIDVEEVNRYRQQLGMSIERLATSAKVNEKTLRRWLGGQPAFLENVARLAEALGVTPCDLLCDEQEEPGGDTASDGL